MRSLGARITLLLVTAIVLVVIFSSLAASMVMRGPRPDGTMEPVARQLHVLVNLAEHDRAAVTAAGVLVAPVPASGIEDDILTKFLTEALLRTGPAQQVIVNRPDRNNHGATASLLLADGSWVLAPMPDFSPPPGGWKILVGWLFLIVAGSVLVSVFAAAKITKPLRLIESAVAEIGPDGTLPHVPETGPGEIRATAQALNQLSARVRAATESRMRLVAAAGHDLRTPMTRMRLRAEFIPESEDRRKWLADLEELDRIADSAIGLVREEVSPDGSQAVRLDRITRDVVEELRALGMNVSAAGMQSVTICAAPLALTRALRNLMINASTHGQAAVVSVLRDEGRAIVKIDDIGPGIPEDRLGQVFEPFFRIDIARQKSFPGAGLGMAIAKEIITRFDGNIRVANRTPKGLEQIVSFPAEDKRSIDG